MTTHTPGPWHITKGAFGDLHVGPAILQHPEQERVEYAEARGLDLVARRLADANLVATAPNMLAALKYVLACIECGDPADPQIIRDTAALAEGLAP